MRQFKIALAFALVMTTGACSTVGQGVSNLVVSTTSSSPTQPTNVGEATLAATGVEKVTSGYVNSGKSTPAVRAELRILANGIHNILKAAEDANTKGESATVAALMQSIREALDAFNAYRANKGIPTS